MLEAFRRMVLEDRLRAALIRPGDSVIINEAAILASKVHCTVLSLYGNQGGTARLFVPGT